MEPLSDYFLFGYWLFTKDHPELAVVYHEFIDFVDSGVVAVNTFPEADPRSFIETHDEALMDLYTNKYSAKAFLEMWNELINNYEHYSPMLEKLFRLYMHDYEQCVAGNFTEDYCEYAASHYPLALDRLRRYNDLYFNFDVPSESDVEELRITCRQIRRELGELARNLRQMYPANRYRTPFMSYH